MNGATPFAIAQIVARNIVPLVGILAFHWSTGNVLILYLLDTVLAMGVIVAGIASNFAPAPDDEGLSGRINAEAGYVLTGLLVAGFMAIPLGTPVGIMLAISDFSFRDALHDASLRVGMLIQSALALWSYVGLYRALRTHTPEQLQLKKRFALVFMRWLAVIMATYVILDILPPGEFVLVLLVIAYIVASIFAEINPDRFLRSMPGGETNLAPDSPAPLPVATRSATRAKTLHNKD
jgi:Family of unknown function (DUF6498)